MVTHRGLASLAGSMAAAFGIGPGSRVLQLASLSFDAAVMEVLMAWPAGAALVVPEPGPLAGEMPGASTLNELRVSHALIVPTALASVPAGRVRGLECLIVGGEACPGVLVAQWSAGRRMFNAYGPTEVTIAATLAGPLSGWWFRRSAGRSGTRGCSCWTRGWGWCRRGWRGSCTWRGRGWRGGTWAGRG